MNPVCYDHNLLCRSFGENFGNELVSTAWRVAQDYVGNCAGGARADSCRFLHNSIFDDLSRQCQAAHFTNFETPKGWLVTSSPSKIPCPALWTSNDYWLETMNRARVFYESVFAMIITVSIIIPGTARVPFFSVSQQYIRLHCFPVYRIGMYAPLQSREIEICDPKTRTTWSLQSILLDGKCLNRMQEEEQLIR